MCDFWAGSIWLEGFLRWYTLFFLLFFLEIWHKISTMQLSCDETFIFIATNLKRSHAALWKTPFSSPNWTYFVYFWNFAILNIKQWYQTFLNVSCYLWRLMSSKKMVFISYHILSFLSAILLNIMKISLADIK